MPTYEYQCSSCGHAFEEFQSITAKSLRKCPKCSKPKLKRLIGIGAGVIFKGSGFYETDYRSENYKKDAKADKEAGKESKDSTDSKASTDKSTEKTSDKSTGDSKSPAKKNAGTDSKSKDTPKK